MCKTVIKVNVDYFEEIYCLHNTFCLFCACSGLHHFIVLMPSELSEKRKGIDITIWTLDSDGELSEYSYCKTADGTLKPAAVTGLVYVKRPNG